MATTNTNSTPKLVMFQKSRIAIELLIRDTIEYTVSTFNQGRSVYTVASGFGQVIFCTQNIAQLILYYIEDAISELNILSATRANSVYGLAALAGHTATRAIAATGEIAIIASNPGSQNLPSGVVIIPNYTTINCITNGLNYILSLPSDSISLSANGTDNGTTIVILQGSIETQVFTGLGTPLQSFSVSSQQTALIDNSFVNVYVNGEKWTYYNSIYDIPLNGKGYIIRNGITSGIDIIFGNTYFGLPPVLGAQITVEYLVNSGSSGNVALASDTDVTYTWTDTGYTIFGDEVDLNQTFSITNVNAPGFGSNPEPLALTRLIAPKMSRSFVLATPDNYIVFLEKFNIFSIINAYTNPDPLNVSDDNVIFIFLVLDVRTLMTSNENYFTLTEDQFMLSTIQINQILKLITDSGSQIMTTVVSIVQPTISKYVINIAIITLQGFSLDNIKATILQRLSDYFIQIRRRDRIPRSDLITLLESISGIDTISLSIISERDELAMTQYLSLTPEQKTAIAPPTPTAIDSFGDIIIGTTDLPLIYGGWTDSRGIEYGIGINPDSPSAVNIIVRDTIASTYNTSYNANTIADITSTSLSNSTSTN